MDQTHCVTRACCYSYFVIPSELVPGRLFRDVLQQLEPLLGANCIVLDLLNQEAELLLQVQERGCRSVTRNQMRKVFAVRRTIEYSTKLVEITVNSCELRWDLLERVHHILDDEQVMSLVYGRAQRRRRGRRVNDR